MGGGESKSKGIVYGEIPGYEKAGTDFAEITRQLLAGGQYPGGTETQGLLNQFSGGLFGGARDLLQERLSPDWLTTRSPGLDAVQRAMRERAEMERPRRMQDLLMRFGSAGQSPYSSSPMFEAMERGDREADLDLNQAFGAQDYEDYMRRASEQGGAMTDTLGRTMTLATTREEQYRDLLMNLLRMMQAGKGQIYQGQQSSGGEGLGSLFGGLGTLALGLGKMGVGLPPV